MLPTPAVAEVAAVLRMSGVDVELRFALGDLSRRDEVIELLRGLPQATVADNDEVVRLIDQDVLYCAGIGYVDAQLLAATS